MQGWENTKTDRENTSPVPQKSGTVKRSNHGASGRIIAVVTVAAVGECLGEFPRGRIASRRIAGKRGNFAAVAALFGDRIGETASRHAGKNTLQSHGIGKDKIYQQVDMTETAPILRLS